ncbi:MAG: alpha/beta fold hydrolase, partial [Gemmatimonadetes bacterium]|nr:alpha/beta fold hydrolase [Gemmatimonadota bacterium]
MFVPFNPRHHGSPGARVAAAVLAVVGAMLGAGLHANRSLSASTPWIAIAVAGIVIALGLVVFVRFMSEREERAAAASPDESDNRHHVLLILIALVAGLVALGLFVALTPRAAASQEAMAAPAPVTQSAFILTRGADTIIVERLTRGRSSITGDLTIKGQARMIFTAEVAPGPFVPTFTFKAWGPGADISTTPLQTGIQTMTADSALITIAGAGGERRIARAIKNRPIAIMNNDFATTELVIQRARAAGTPKATVPVFSLSGGVQLDMTVEFIGADSAIVGIAGQVTRLGIDQYGYITGGVLASQNIVITRVDGAAVDKISIGRPDYGAPAGAPYTAEEVTVKTPAGHVLTGTLTLPKGAKGKVPAVVTITGSGQQDRDEYISLVSGYRLFRQVADTLGRRGIAVLRLDDRAINGSGGDVQKATSADFADDIRAGVAFLRARGEIDGARIALAGHSEGGMIAPLVASTDPKLAGIVLLAGPAYTGRRIIDFQLKNGVMGSPDVAADKKDSVHKAVVAQFDSSAAKSPWLTYFLQYDPVPTARRVKAPVLILQGGTDQQVTPDQAPALEQAFKSGGNKNVTTHVFKDRNHLFLNDPSGFPGGYVKLKDGRIDGEVMG